MDGTSPVTNGKDAIRQQTGEFMESIEVHSGKIGNPLLNGDQFIVEMWMDCTFKSGPMAEQRRVSAQDCSSTGTLAPSSASR